MFQELKEDILETVVQDNKTVFVQYSELPYHEA